MDDRYEIVWFRGHRTDKMTAQALLEVERRIGYELTVVQGGYNGGVGKVSASAGTHDGGGAVDLAPADAARKVRIGRDVGFAMWERQELWSGGRRIWGHHVHGILIGNAKASPSALRQVGSYRRHRDGLAGDGWDDTPRPTVIHAYKYKVEPTIGVSATGLRVDFLNALDGNAGNSPHRRVRIVQRRLNARLGGADLLVDGVVGEKTLNHWGRWEAGLPGGAVGRPRLPDPETLRPLLRGTIWYATA